MSTARLGNGDRRIAVLDALGLLNEHRETRFDQVLAMSAEFFHMPRAALILAGRSSLILKAAYGFTSQAPNLAGSFTEAVMLSDTTLVIPDATLDSRFADSEMVVGPPFIRLYVGQRLLAPGGEVIGAFAMSSPETRAFDEETQHKFRRVARWIEDELARETDRTRAAEVQRALTPRRVELAGYEIVGASTPARAVGGDLFDWHLVDGGVAVTVADVMGKGVGAALIASTVRAVLRAADPTLGVDESVAMASRILDEDLSGTNSFATLFHAIVQQDTGSIDYVDAGHGLTLIVRVDGTFERLAQLDLPLGAQLSDDWTLHQNVLNPGDTLISFSDGVLDLFDGGFGSFDSVAALVARSTSAADAVSILASMAEEDPDSDDVVVLAVRRAAP
jgi:serine phosphatase RsbU (regulator of sigma subunit)